MKTYVLSITGTAILAAVVSLLAPGKKYGKALNGILKLCVLLTVVTPIFHYVRQENGDFFKQKSIFGQDVAYINNSYALAIEKQLKKQFGVTVRADIDVSDLSAIETGRMTGGLTICKKVTVYIDDFGMNANEQHINIIAQIAETVKSLCGCDVEIYDESA